MRAVRVEAIDLLFAGLLEHIRHIDEATSHQAEPRQQHRKAFLMVTIRTADHDGNGDRDVRRHTGDGRGRSSDRRHCRLAMGEITWGD